MVWKEEQKMESDVKLLSLHSSSEDLLPSCHILPLLLPIVSQGNTYLPPSLIQKTPTQGFWLSSGSPQGGSCSTTMHSILVSLHILSLLLPIVSQGNTYLLPTHIQKTPT